MDEHDHDHSHDHAGGVTVREPVDGSWPPQGAAGLVTLEVDGELLLLDPRTDGLHRLDRLGTIIWKVLDGEGSVDELVDDLAGAFGTPAEVVRSDLEELLVKLQAAGLLHGSDPPAYLLLANKEPAPAGVDAEGIWRPEYL
ncbi:MAG: PqqD family protein, partial [Acidimicrobiales bacterium]